jgi:hypothetical protein
MVGSEIGSHQRIGTTQKGKRVSIHPCIAHREQFLDAAPSLLDQHFDWVGPVRRWFPFGLHAEWHLLPPLGAFCTSLVELFAGVPMIS